MASFLFELVSSSRFYKETLGNKPDLFKGAFTKTDYDFSVEDFEETLWAFENVLNERLRVNKGGEDTIIPKRAHGKDLFRWSVDQFSQGSTLVFNGIDSISIRTARISRELDLYYEGQTTANAFLTPPNCKGFPPHFDTHDVFILQTSGTKRWLVYGPEINHPTPEQIFHIDKSVCRVPIIDIVLFPGDILYIPRGFVHEAEAQVEASLHVTIGIRPKKSIDILSAALGVIAENHESLRRNIVIYGEEEKNKTVSAALEVVNEEISKPYIKKRIESRVKEIFVTQLRPIAGGHLNNALIAEELRENSTFQMREESPCSLSEEKDNLLLTFPGMGVTASKDIKPGYLVFPYIYYGILNYLLLKKNKFQCSDIPGPYKTKTKLEILSRLTRAGVIKVNV
jgi:ribosomal protein L16 Arg81 hydroxylase